MIHSFQASCPRLRALVFAALILAVAGCESSESFNPDGGTAPDALDAGEAAAPTLASVSFAGGIPFGTFAQPITEYGSRYNGGHKNIAPNLLVAELAAIKARGGRVLLTFTGSPKRYLEGGHFSMTKWKARVDRYRGLNIASYAKDGTIIGHYMIDEPNDPANWNGRPVPPSVLEEMAKYSKQIWPDMATVVRVSPSYLASSHHYLDAAWSQYLSRRGDVGNYIRDEAAEAQRKGLALIVGLNVIHGGTPQGTTMTASEVESWGSALLNSTYPCAFISWTYNSGYLSSSSIKSAMDALRRKAQSRAGKSCRGG